jgi:hypothetical protein
VEERERKLFYNFFKVRELCSLSLLLFSQLELFENPEFYKSLELVLLEISSKRQARVRSLPVGKKKDDCRLCFVSLWYTIGRALTA